LQYTSVGSKDGEFCDGVGSGDEVCVMVMMEKYAVVEVAMKYTKLECVKEVDMTCTAALHNTSLWHNIIEPMVDAYIASNNK
jgi:hypothetical protein